MALAHRGFRRAAPRTPRRMALRSQRESRATVAPSSARPAKIPQAVTLVPSFFVIPSEVAESPSERSERIPPKTYAKRFKRAAPPPTERMYALRVAASLALLLWLRGRGGQHGPAVRFGVQR